MLKQLLKMSGLFLILACITLPAQAQKFPAVDKSPVDIAMYRIDGTPAIKVVYGRPAKRERPIFGADLVPYDQVWRTGANEATEIRLYKDAKIAGKDVKAGIYSLFSIPGEDNWTIILSNQTDVWGAYQYDDEQDVVRVEVPAGEGEDVIEYFAITFMEVEDAVHMVLGWDTVRVEVPFTF